MKAWRIQDTDNGPRARLAEMSFATLTEGDVTIAGRYSSLNYKDALAITGAGRIARTRPLNAGIDIAGVVHASNDARFEKGDPVLVTGWLLSETRDGGLAEYVRVPGDCVTRLPVGLDAWEAMALGTAGFTAGMAIKRMADNAQRPEDGPIAVTGAGGGVGMFAIEMLAQAGFQPIAVTRRGDTLADRLRALGASEIMAPEALAPGNRPLESERFAGAIDTLGGEPLAGLLSRVKGFGNVAAIGLAAGTGLNASVLPFILRGVSLLGINSVSCPVDWREAIWQQLAGPLKPAHLAEIADTTIGMAEVGDACDAILAGEHIGRTVVDLSR